MLRVALHPTGGVLAAGGVLPPEEQLPPAEVEEVEDKFLHPIKLSKSYEKDYPAIAMPFFNGFNSNLEPNP